MSVGVSAKRLEDAVSRLAARLGKLADSQQTVRVAAERDSLRRTAETAGDRIDRSLDALQAALREGPRHG